MDEVSWLLFTRGITDDRISAEGRVEDGIRKYGHGFTLSCMPLADPKGSRTLRASEPEQRRQALGEHPMKPEWW